MNKLEKLKLKHEILQTIYDAMCFEQPEIIGEELTKTEAQIDILEEEEK